MLTGLSLLCLTLTWICWHDVLVPWKPVWNFSQRNLHTQTLSKSLNKWTARQLSSVSDTAADRCSAHSQFEFIFHVMQNTQTCYAVHTQTLSDHGFPHTKNNVTFIINDTTTESMNRLWNLLQGHCCHWHMQLCARVNAWRWECLGIDSLRNILQTTLKPISLPSASLVAMTRRAEQCLIIYGHI